MKLAGIDLAWQSENNPTAVAHGELCRSQKTLRLTSVKDSVVGLECILENIETENPKGVAIDAPLIIKNEEKQRPCENEISKEYGSRKASAHSSNLKRYRKPMSVKLSKRLEEKYKYSHRGTKSRWQIECYPHPALIEIFNLDERLKYKKGIVAEKKCGQKKLAEYLKSLDKMKCRANQILALKISENCKKYFETKHIDSLEGRKLKSNEDALDAVVCLYIAGLFAMGKRNGKCFGDQETGSIWVPKIN